MSVSDQTELLQEYLHWLDIIGNQIQRTSDRKITEIIIETDPNKLKALAQKASYQFHENATNIVETYCQ